MTTATILILLGRLARVRSDRIDAPDRAGDSLAVYVEDSAQLADTIAALDDAARVMANPLEEVRAWLVADLHSMGRPDLAAEAERDPANVKELHAWTEAIKRLPGMAAMLSPRTRAALGIGG